MARQVSIGFHLGVHKTASTHLQHSLGRSRDALIDRGVRFYGPEYLRLRGRKIDQMFGIGEAAAPKRSVADQVGFLAKSDSRVLISEENFTGILFDANGNIPIPVYPDGPRNVAALAALLAAEGVPLDLYVALRSPASFVTSCYSQSIFGGSFSLPQDYAANNRPEAISWVDMVAALAAIPQKRSLYVWRFEDYPRIFPEVVAAMVGQEAAAVVPPVEGITNPSLSAAAIEGLRAAREINSAWLTPARARRRFPTGPDMLPPALFSAQDLRRDALRYEEEMARIGAIPGVTLIRP